MSIADQRTDTSPTDLPARKGWLAAGGVLGAILASACCIGPLVLLTLGISGAWIGNLTALEPYKPVFAVIALGFIAAGFRQVYFRRPVVCEPGSCCASPASARITKAALWASLILVLGALTIGWWAPLLY
ncbi:mercuric transporter MerT family protein [Maliponia aquimaris]|uniref:Mercuric transport protein MerT n=1 Tax=Maliponia aquimaris TaxID=1673631 RepID=A0A238KUK3_9RHOB|nr:mercuric transporter MerT family protein [Maliponia aquimaris]SMX45842.1 MerT mercuric transport protein [Maliponia aquimaris]